MRRAEIALFKRFLSRKGLEKIFVAMYRSQNEDKIEYYLDNIAVDKVITHAFTLTKEDSSSPFLTNQFWEQKQREWQQEIVSADINGWFSRDNLEIDKWLRVPYNAISDNLGKKKHKEEEQKQNSTTTPSSPLTTESSFKFFDLGRTQTTSASIDDNEIVVNSRPGSNRVSFSKVRSKEIIESGLQYIAIGRDEYTGIIRIVFNNEHGIPYPKSCAKAGHVVVNSKQLVDLLKKIFGRDENYFSLHISDNIANSPKYLTYNVTL